MPDSFDALAARSRSLHGHRYVLPVAAWILLDKRQLVTAGEVMAGLGGRVDRPRVIEALAKLAELGALSELPRGSPRNAPRFFERVAHPYWNLVEAYLAELEASPSDSSPPRAGDTKGGAKANENGVNLRPPGNAAERA